MTRFQLFLDTARLKFTTSSEAEPKLDEHGNQRLDKQTKQPLFSVGVVAWFDGGAEVMNVAIAGTKPTVTPGQTVSLTNLRAVPWIRGTAVNIAYKADAVTVANGK